MVTGLGRQKEPQAPRPRLAPAAKQAGRQDRARRRAALAKGDVEDVGALLRAGNQVSTDDAGPPGGKGMGRDECEGLALKKRVVGGRSVA
jgi:hypothetical protein